MFQWWFEGGKRRGRLGRAGCFGRLSGPVSVAWERPGAGAGGAEGRRSNFHGNTPTRAPINQPTVQPRLRGDYRLVRLDQSIIPQL